VGSPEPHGGQVVSVEEYLSAALEEIDEALRGVIRLRDQAAARIHALRMADDEGVRAAMADYRRRAAEQRPYEDAMSVEELVAKARADADG
jgi:uncharacterized membrane protein YccC